MALLYTRSSYVDNFNSYFIYSAVIHITVELSHSLGKDQDCFSYNSIFI